MSETTELLDFVYKNAKMGEETLPYLIGAVSRPDLRTALSSQLVEYCEIVDAAKEEMRRRGTTPKKPGALKHAATEAMLRANTLHDRSPRHIAEMMVRGSAMGTVQMTKRIHAYQFTAAPSALTLARRLLETEERNIRQMKAFL